VRARGGIGWIEVALRVLGRDALARWRVAVLLMGGVVMPVARGGSLSWGRCGLDVFSDGCEVAEEGISDYVFDEGFGVGGGVAEGLLVLGEVGGGDLEAVEEHAGGFEIDVAKGDAGEDVVDGDLDGGTVVDAGHEEAAVSRGEAGLAAGGVMVVAEFMAAEGRRAAAVPVGEDVAATVAAGGIGVGGVGLFGRKAVHGIP
jgi:hypothetical protein